MAKKGANAYAGSLGYLLGCGHKGALFHQTQGRIDYRFFTALTAQTSTVELLRLTCLRHRVFRYGVSID
jgi:hypothetical protein